MSIQTYNDIIAIQPQIQDLQVSSQNKISQNSSSTSFAEMVAFYRNESNSENSKVNESVKSENDTKSTETVQKSEKSDSSEKTDAVEKGERVEKNENSEKTEASKELKTTESPKIEKAEKKQVVLDFNKTEKVSEKANQNQKKIDKKEFARFNQIAENAVNVNERVEVAALNVDVNALENNTQNLKLEIGGENDDSEVSVELLSENVEESLLLANQNQVNSTENDAQEFDFDFNQKEPSDKKVSKLDKEGKITVEDFRTKLDAEPKTVNEENEPKLKADLEITGENTATITMDIAQNAQNDILSLNNQTAASDGSNFRAMLNNQIQNNAPEFVKAGNIILKDNNQGTIDLVLHPDDLGNVKIHLSLDGKNLTGQITVATKEALEVFKDNAETLREAFIKSGFEAANFDVAYGNNNSGFGQNGEFTNQNDGRNYVAHQVYGSLSGSDDSEADSFFENSSDLENYSINIVA